MFSIVIYYCVCIVHVLIVCFHNQLSMEVEDMEQHEVPDALTTPTMDINGDWRHGDGSPRNEHGPAQDKLQKQVDINNFLDKLGNFTEAESETSVITPSEDNESSQDSQEDYVRSGLDIESRVMEERESPQAVMNTEKGLLEKLQEAEKVKESESQNLEEKEKEEKEIITIYDNKSKEKRNTLKKVNMLATDLKNFISFEKTTVTLGQASKDQLEGFVIPVANLLLETVYNSKVITSAEWATSQASEVWAQIQEMPHADIPLKALAKNAQVFLLSNLLDNLKQVSEIVGEAMEETATIEDLKIQLEATIQLSQVTTDLLKEKKEELKEDQRRTKIEVQNQKEQTMKWQKEYEEEAKAHRDIKKKYEELKTARENVNEEEMKNLQASLASGKQTMSAQMMLIQSLREAAEEKDNWIAAYKISMEQEVSMNNQTTKELRDQTYPELAKKPKLEDGMEDRKEMLNATQATTRKNTYAEQTNKKPDVLKNLVERKGFLTFNYSGPEMFGPRSVEEAVRSVEYIQVFLGAMMNDMQKAWQEDFRDLYHQQDEQRADKAFKTIMKRLSKARGTQELKTYLARNREREWTEPENETLKRRNIIFFQQFPNISPSRKMFQQIWNKDKKAIHIYAVLGLLSLYAPRLYACLVKWDMGASENMRRKFADVLSPRGTSKWYQALHILCLIVMDQADIVENSYNFKTGHNLAKRPFNGKMVPSDDPYLTEEVLQEIKESRPISYTMDELKTIFCDQNFTSFQEVYAAERTKIKEGKATFKTKQQNSEDLSMFE